MAYSMAPRTKNAIDIKSKTLQTYIFHIEEFTYKGGSKSKSSTFYKRTCDNYHQSYLEKCIYVDDTALKQAREIPRESFIKKYQ